MFHSLFAKLDRLFRFAEVKAHCDIPCGIYDPHLAQIAALTVIRMIDLANDLQKNAKETLEQQNSLTRYILVKEEHAELAKKEIRVIFGDFIKKEHVEKYPDLPVLVHKIYQLGSKARQTVDRAAGLELLFAINQFAEIFWEIKGIPTRKVKAPYAPGEEVVYPVL